MWWSEMGSGAIALSSNDFDNDFEWLELPLGSTLDHWLRGFTRRSDNFNVPIEEYKVRYQYRFGSRRLALVNVA